MDDKSGFSFLILIVSHLNLAKYETTLLQLSIRPYLGSDLKDAKIMTALLMSSLSNRRQPIELHLSLTDISARQINLDAQKYLVQDNHPFLKVMRRIA